MSRSLFHIDAVEVHAAGEPGRVILNAEQYVHGDTMVERFDYCRTHLQGLRRAILREPRGYPALCGVFVLPPVNPGSHFGVIVLEQGGFTPMSGSNTMCAVTAMLEGGHVTMTEPVTEVTIDTAVGTVTARAQVRAGRVESVTVVNVPAYVVELDRSLDVPELGTLKTDIVFGGQFFAQVCATDLGLGIEPGNGRALARAGALIKLAAQQQVPVAHPVNGSVAGVSLVMLHDGKRVPGRPSRNTVVMTNGPLLVDDPVTWTGALDRSPCGTGTSARMAALHARGQLAVGEEFRHRSVIDSEFVGHLVGETTVAGLLAVLPTVTGSAWVTGTSTWQLDPTDPYPQGFTVGDIWAPQPGDEPVLAMNEVSGR